MHLITEPGFNVPHTPCRVVAKGSVETMAHFGYDASSEQAIELEYIKGVDYTGTILEFQGHYVNYWYINQILKEEFNVNSAVFDASIGTKHVMLEGEQFVAIILRRADLCFSVAEMIGDFEGHDFITKEVEELFI